MARGRIETTPSEQLVALRKARDRYVALADRFKDGTDSATTRLDERERDARRIASAYDKSITNMAAKMVRAGTSSRTRSFINNVGMARPIFAVAVSVAALVALIYPGIFESLRASVKAPPAAHVAPAPVAVQPPIMHSETAVGGSPAPSPRPSSAADHPPAPLRTTAVAEQIHPLARPTKAASAKTSEADDAGFVAKVLQPDGSLKEVHFPTTPRH